MTALGRVRRALMATAVTGLLVSGLAATTAATPHFSAHIGAEAGTELSTELSTETVDVDVVIPEVADGPFEVSNAQLRWGLNVETGSGAFYGGCNFLSAGVVGDTDGGKVWNEGHGFYSATDGSTTIEKPYRAGSQGYEYRTVPFADRCLGPDGTPVRSALIESTGVQAVIEDGVGSIDPEAGTAEIQWEGSFTVVFYGGLTYWWVVDPYLTVADGRGTLRGTVGGYGTDMDDMTKWVELRPRDLVLADLPEVNLSGASGFAADPSYRGVRISVPPGAAPQVREGSNWGSFPQDFVDFQVETGQAAYWYTSGGIRDAAKPASTVYVNYDADNAPDPAAPVPPQTPDSELGGGGVLPPLAPLPPWAPATAVGSTAPGGGSVAGAGGILPGLMPTPALSAPQTQTGDQTVAGDGAATTAEATPPGVIRAAVATQSTWPSTGLIPDSILDGWNDPRTATFWALSGFFGLSSLAVIGFRRGWFVLPWTKTGT